ncbi:LOW QUALITY PROTEIN: V-set and transmembrane domain-containing protein 1-like [Gracilinanus agilis]|uniref:LOW QUALITY PROTEIN: V-set and transmembrane domain-containing protein 1-like n=1 Tax=Gracilinanus agilis TaxID=191870 RepID=UPI001CFCC9F8|nr:LOW QUALITY PROTEIN: V-set and transmembrane domain-containing protein 1-like [Gracilinanus agilis]
MTPALSVLLCLGLCLCKRTRTQAADGLPKPSLRAENSSLVPQGGAVTLRCRGSWEAEEWQLEKKGGSGWSLIKSVRGAGNEGEFSLPSVTPYDAGTYRCFYRNSFYLWSEASDPLELVVTGTSKDPHLSQSSETSPALTSAPPSPSILQVSILVGVSVFLILTFLFFSLLYLHCSKYQPKLGKGDRETNIKTTRSSEQAGSTLEETVYTAVNDDRQTEARQKDPAVSHSDLSSFAWHSPYGGNREGNLPPGHTQLGGLLDSGSLPPEPSCPNAPSIPSSPPASSPPVRLSKEKTLRK